MNIFSGAFTLIKPRLDDSGVDRMNYYYTPVIISFLAVTLTAKQYVGAPLQCWVPAQFTKAWEQYAENYCFVYNTYWVRPDDEVPTDVEDRITAQLIYYQWVPFIMVLEAGLFHLPARIWTALSKSSGVNLEAMVKNAMKADEEHVLVCEKKWLQDDDRLKATVQHVCSLLEDSNQLRTVRSEGAGKYAQYTRLGELDGMYLSNVYLAAKLMYCLNGILQFTMMNKFLKQPDAFWGASILTDIVSGTNWEDSGNFPRIAMCDFQVRTLGNLQRYSIQCVLILNMFNEKIFLFLYWWIITIGLLTWIDCILLAISVKIPSRRRVFVKRFLQCKPEELAVMEDFTTKYLNADMFLIIKMINGHTSQIVTNRILRQLYENYRTSKETLACHPYLVHLREREHEYRSDGQLSDEVNDALIHDIHMTPNDDNTRPYELVKFRPISFQSPTLSG